MQDFQGRRRIKRSIFYKITLVVLAVLILFLSKAVWGVYAKNRLAEVGRTQAESELRELETQKKELQDKVKWLATERGEEEVIRQNYSVLLPGEKVIMVVDAEKPTSGVKGDEDINNWFTAAVGALERLFSW